MKPSEKDKLLAAQATAKDEKLDVWMPNKKKKKQKSRSKKKKMMPKKKKRLQKSRPKKKKTFGCRRKVVGYENGKSTTEISIPDDNKIQKNKKNYH